MSFHDKYAKHWCNDVNGFEKQAQTDGKIHAAWCSVHGEGPVYDLLIAAVHLMNKASMDRLSFDTALNRVDGLGARGGSVTDLDRLLDRAEHRGYLTSAEAVRLIERVKEAERHLEIADNATERLAARAEKAEARLRAAEERVQELEKQAEAEDDELLLRLRAAEEVVEVAKLGTRRGIVGQYSFVFEGRDATRFGEALRHYDEAVKET